MQHTADEHQSKPIPLHIQYLEDLRYLKGSLNDRKVGRRDHHNHALSVQDTFLQMVTQVIKVLRGLLVQEPPKSYVTIVMHRVN